MGGAVAAAEVAFAAVLEESASADEEVFLVMDMTDEKTG